MRDRQVDRDCTYVHWQRYPCKGSQPARVGTVCKSSGPHGATENTLKRFCSSVGERTPSWSYRQRGYGDMSLGGGVEGGVKGQAR